MSNAPPQSTSPEYPSPPPSDTLCISWPSTRAPFPSWLSSPVFLARVTRYGGERLLHFLTRRPPETIAPGPHSSMYQEEEGSHSCLLTSAETPFQNGLGMHFCCCFCLGSCFCCGCCCMSIVIGAGGRST
ncbi:hypothetical protein V1515DRAFT_592625 [Lipomyces mesembrius]